MHHDPNMQRALRACTAPARPHPAARARRTAAAPQRRRLATATPATTAPAAVRHSHATVRALTIVFFPGGMNEAELCNPLADPCCPFLVALLSHQLALQTRTALRPRPVALPVRPTRAAVPQPQHASVWRALP